MHMGEYVVYKLSEALEGFHYCQFFDNFFTSVLLLKRLLVRKLFACGTVRQNRKKISRNHEESKIEPRREILAFHNGKIVAQCIIQLTPQKSSEHLKLVKKKK
jgi:hypothetical protein